MQAIDNLFGSRKVALAVLIAALGYFVDAYDIIIFSIVRIQSLKDLGLTGDELTSSGVLLLNIQMIGMLIGGIAWGIFGDKKGRIKVLMGSILLYSVANLANAFVTNVEQYAVCRFFSGIGLAGEIGAGITLVSELMPKKNRGYATTLVAAIGVAGPILGSVLSHYFSWQTLYIIGGVMGLTLLCLRTTISESTIFTDIPENKDSNKGSILLLFVCKYRAIRFLSCILLGVPIWLIMGIFVIFAPEVGAALGIQTPLSVATAVMISGIALVSGDLASGFLSQIFKNRIKTIYVFIIMIALSVLCALSGIINTATTYYIFVGFACFFIGYWAVLLTMISEQFGTNLRATVTTSAPNFIRASTVILTSAFLFFKPDYGVIGALSIISCTVFILAFISLLYLRETYGKDLNYLEIKK